MPYVRVLLRCIRASYIGAWHHARLLWHEGNCLKHREEMHRHHQEGQEALTELCELGVFAFDNPLRGVALYLFIAQDGSKEREAYFVYKDSRDGIDDFILHDDLYVSKDLLGFERPVPEAWKQTGAIPKLVQGAGHDEATAEG